MKQFILLIIVCLIFNNAFPQSFAGITGVVDTSYNTNSTYRKIKKKYPDIKIVNELPSPGVREERDIVYCKIGVRALMLDAFYPKQKISKRPAILIIHGGGWRSGSRTQHYPLAQRLAGLGYVCFTPEYRLSTEAIYPAAIHDIKSSIKWIKKNAHLYNVDTFQIVALGFSAGGELAAFMGVTNNMKNFEGPGCHPEFSDNVQAVVNIDGTLSFIHPESGEGDDIKKTSAASYWFGYSKKENPQLWEQASPLTYAGKNTPPTLFINSSVARMHAGREDYIKILNSYNIYTEVQQFENSPHDFCLFHPWFEPTVSYIDDFLRKVFKK